MSDRGERSGLRPERDGPPVLYVAHQREYSGAELLSLPLMAADRTALVACPPESATAHLLSSADIFTAPLAYRQMRYSGGWLTAIRSVGHGLRGARDLRALMRANPERSLILGLSIRDGLLASVGGLGLRRSIVWVVPDLLPPPPLRWLVKTIARISASRLIPISRLIEGDLVGRTTLAAKTQLVYPGVDLQRFCPAPAAPGPTERVRVGVLGHISAVKRTDLAVDVAAALTKAGIDFELVIVGRAQYQEESFALEADLRTRVEGDPRLKRHVRFGGYSDDPAETLRGIDVLLHCRADEPFGMVMVEAMACGLPVVAPASGGALEIVDDGVTGLLYSPGEVSAAAACLLTLLREPSRRKQMGIAARRSAEERFSGSRFVAEMVAQLDAVSSSRR